MISITIEDNGAVSLKTTKGVVETEMAAEIVVEAMRNLFKPKDNESNELENDMPVQTNYYLYLNKVERDNKVNTVKVLRDQLNIPLERAKAIVNTICDGKSDILIFQSTTRNKINIINDALESVGCVCEITSSK